MISLATKIVKHDTNKNCLYCTMELSGGRSDRKFCNNNCRSHFNNELSSAANNYIRTVNKILGKNRRILKAFLDETEGETVKIDIDRLMDNNYNFKYHTHLYISPTGKTYFYCYEYGYLPLENNWYLVVQHKK